MVGDTTKERHQHISDVTGQGALTVYRPAPAQLPPLQFPVIATPSNTEAAPSALALISLIFKRRPKQLQDDVPAVWFLRMSQHSTRTVMLYMHVKSHFTYRAIGIYLQPLLHGRWFADPFQFVFSLRRLLLNLPLAGLIHNIINTPILIFRLSTPAYSFHTPETEPRSIWSHLTL